MNELNLCRSDNGNKTQGLLSLVCYSNRGMISPWLRMAPMVWRVAIDFHDARHDTQLYRTTDVEFPWGICMTSQPWDYSACFTQGDGLVIISPVVNVSRRKVWSSQSHVELGKP